MMMSAMPDPGDLQEGAIDLGSESDERSAEHAAHGGALVEDRVGVETDVGDCAGRSKNCGA